MDTLETSAVIYKDGNVWIASSLMYDVMIQSSAFEEAKSLFMKAMSEDYLLACANSMTLKQAVGNNVVRPFEYQIDPNVPYQTKQEKFEFGNKHIIIITHFFKGK